MSDATRPPTRRSGRPPDNLPLELTSFVGREQEIAEVKELLTKHRLITLTGPGGCGKTRLALRVAGDLTEEFRDDVLWVGLASLSDAGLVPQAVASRLDVRETPGGSFVEALADHFGSKKTLLVLDNCEHLVNGCAELVDTLLRACPDLKILTTSREALGITGEITWLVPPLSLPDSSRLPDLGTLVRYEAVRLFVERAESVVSTFELAPKNAPAVARLCQQLDGMPLAIELAAARVRVLSVEQISVRLDDCFRLLKTDGRMALPRHRTLRATIDWSYGLLSEEEKILFRRLSVFAGGFSLEAAESVCAGVGIEEDEVLDQLTHLVDKSLVLVAEQDGEARYRLLETVRKYGWEKLQQSGEEAEIRRRQASFFLALAETAEPVLLGPEQAAWLGRLEREHDNLRAALGWLEEEGETEWGLRLAGALWRFWWFRGYYAEGRAQLRALLALPGAEARTVERAKALYALGVLAFRRGDYEAGDQAEARRYQEESLEIYRELGDDQRTSGALRELGRINIELGDWETARPFLEESLKLEKELGNRHGYALTLSSLGWLTHFQGEHAAARPLIEESLGIFRELGDTLYIGICLYFLGRIATELGEYSAARAWLMELLRTVPTVQYRWGVPNILEAFARLAAAQGSYRLALRLAGAATALREAIGAAQSPAWRADMERKLEPAWREWGAEAGAAAWEEGRALTIEQALQEAMREPSEPQDDSGPATRPSVRIFALGPARVERDGRDLVSADWTYAKPRELLYYLLSHPPRTKEQIGLALWPEASPSQLRNSFHPTLHHLRRALGGTEWIVFEKGRYSFNRSLDYFFDVEAFEASLAEARRIQGEAPAQAIHYLKEAVDLYGGDFLEDFLGGEWILLRQEELRREYQEALLELGQLLCREGRHAEAAEAYRKAIAHDRYSEITHRELMRCYARQGEHGQALRHYWSLVELLDDELGAQPAPETVALFERLRRGEGV